MAAGKKLTDEQRDLMSVLMFDAGKSVKEICKFVGCSETQVSVQRAMETLAKQDDVQGIINYAKRCNTGDAVVDWVLKKYNKTATSSLQGEEQECQYLQVDKDQMARIMYALGKIDERLAPIETIENRLYNLENAFDAFRNEDISMRSEHNKQENANADSLYKLITDFRNSIIMEMRKRK